MDPTDPETAGLVEKGRRAIDPSYGKDDKDRRLRAATRRKLYAELNDERRALGLLRPPGAMHWSISELKGIPLIAGKVSRLIEKIVRGIQFLEGGLYIEEPLRLSIFVGYEHPTWKMVEEVIAQRGHRYAIEPGIVVWRCPLEDGPTKAMFSIEIWATWKFLACVTENMRAGMFFHEPSKQVHPMQRKSVD